ncbi:MAG: hypothetical protein HOJ35_10460 [Bdellovibrionales bacterium]|nr:hypothetical protein [Bdellovibrionales bacterium]
MDQLIKKVLYIGNDLKYWDNLKSSFGDIYPGEKFIFSELDEQSTVNTFFSILSQNPNIIYYDLNNNRDQSLQLARMVKRELTIDQCINVMIVDSKNNMKELFTSFVNFIFIKCGEFEDIVYGPTRAAFPDIEKRLEFAQALLLKDIKLNERLRLSCISPLNLYLEGNTRFEEGDTIELETEIPENILPSSKFTVKNISSSNLYYDYRFGLDLTYNFIDSSREDDAYSTLSKKEMAAKHENILKNTQQEFRKWVIGNIAGVVPRDTKILVVDKNYNILRTADTLPDKYNYAFRYQQNITKYLYYLDYFRPHIIAIEPEGMSESEAESDDIGSIKLRIEQEQLFTIEKIIHEIKTIGDYSPFFVIFNTQDFSSEFLRKKFDYPLILAHKEAINFNLIIEMADMYEEKQDKKINGIIHNKLSILKKEQPVKYKTISVNDFKAKRYIIRKKNNLKNANYIHKAKIFSISETEILLMSDKDLFVNTIYWLDDPVPMAVTIVPAINKDIIYIEMKGKRFYEAIIHCVGEEEKKKVRKFINEVFYSESREDSVEKLKEYHSYKQEVLDSIMKPST